MIRNSYSIPEALIRIILKEESEKLRWLASKITKVPDKINIPEEYR